MKVIKLGFDMHGDQQHNVSFEYKGYVLSLVNGHPSELLIFDQDRVGVEDPRGGTLSPTIEGILAAVAIINRAVAVINRPETQED